MSRFCAQCGTERAAAVRYCTSCGKAFAENTAPSKHSPTPTNSAPPRDASIGPANKWSDYDWKLVGKLLWGGFTAMSVFVLFAAGLHWTQHRIDGRYVCGDAGFPMTILISGSTGHMDMGIAHIRLMDVELHGDTVSMSGGYAVGADGREIDAQTRASITGGDNVDLLRLDDGGQTLTMDLGGGKRAVFVRQR